MSNAARIEELIERLGLLPHPEGGHYAEVHRSGAKVSPLDGRTHRAALTSIYFLLREGEKSLWHRVASDEVWCHLEGAPIELHCLDDAALDASSKVLGPVCAGVQPQFTVPAGAWQAARSLGAYSLAACLVGPGFDFADFTLMRADDPLRALIAARHPALRGY